MWVQLWQSLIGCSPGGNPRIKRLDQVPLVKVYHILTYVRNIRVEKCSQQWCYVWFYEDLFSVVPFHALIFSLSVIIFVICWLQGSLLCKVKNLLYIVTFTLLLQLILKLVFFFNSTIMYCVDFLLKALSFWPSWTNMGQYPNSPKWVDYVVLEQIIFFFVNTTYPLILIVVVLFINNSKNLKTIWLQDSTVKKSIFSVDS